MTPSSPSWDRSYSSLPGWRLSWWKLLWTFNHHQHETEHDGMHILIRYNVTIKYYRLGVQRGDLRTCSLRSERWHIRGGDRAYQQQPLWSWSVLQYAAPRSFPLFVIWSSWYLILKEMVQPSSQPMVRPPGSSQPILMSGRSVWA